MAESLQEKAIRVHKECVNLRRLINSALKFDEETHTYTLNGNKLISVTQLLSKHHLSPDYSGVNQELLKTSAEYGNMVHKEIEEWIKFGTFTNNSLELQSFINWLDISGYEIIDSEYLVCNDIIGGKVDLLLRHKESDVYVIVDIKTTSVVHQESVSWQVSLYNHFDEEIALLGMCLHFLKDGSLEIVSAPLKTPKDIEKLIECERNGELFQYELDNLNNALADLSKVETLIANYKALIKQAEAEQKTIHEQIRKEMESRNIKTLPLTNMTITIVADSERRTFDKKAFEKDHPEIDLSKYDKVTPVKGGLKITLKENKENETKTN